MAEFTISIEGTKAQCVEALNDMKHPATDEPQYADHAHAKQHCIDFVSRAQPGSNLSLQVSGGRVGGKSHVQLSFVEDDTPKQ